MRPFGILLAVAVTTAQFSHGADLRIDPKSAALAPPLRADLGLIGVNVHRFRGNAALDLARDAGFQFVRADLLWERVERAGAYRFQTYDGLLNALQARGMGALWILDYGHPEHGGKVPRSAEDVAAFGRFAEAVARHYSGRNVRYEIWNEPDLAQFWPQKPSPQEYAALLRTAVASIHGADPAAQVVSGGVSRFDLKFLRKAIDPATAAGLTAIGVHPYPKDNPEKIGPELEKVRQWARQSFGDRVPIWDTEWGYSSTDSTARATGNGHREEGRLRQALLAAREILTVWNAGFPLAVWYDLQDDGTDPENPEQNYGLLDASGAPKPALQAIRTALAAAKGRHYGGSMERMPGGMHAMRFDGSSDALFVVWSERGKRQPIRFPTGDLASVTDFLGRALDVKSDGSEAAIDIDEASGPVYLLWKPAPAPVR